MRSKFLLFSLVAAAGVAALPAKSSAQRIVVCDDCPRRIFYSSRGDLGDRMREQALERAARAREQAMERSFRAREVSERQRELAVERAERAREQSRERAERTRELAVERSQRERELAADRAFRSAVDARVRAEERVRTRVYSPPRLGRRVW
jgi:hypothetical protein